MLITEELSDPAWALCGTAASDTMNAAATSKAIARKLRSDSFTISPSFFRYFCFVCGESRASMCGCLARLLTHASLRPTIVGRAGERFQLPVFAEDFRTGTCPTRYTDCRDACFH